MLAAIKRSSAIEPDIKHIKMYGNLSCNSLKGTLVDALHAVMRVVTHNMSKLLILCANLDSSPFKKC
jgi:hypothetical protein